MVGRRRPAPTLGLLLVAHAVHLAAAATLPLQSSPAPSPAARTTELSSKGSSSGDARCKLWCFEMAAKYPTSEGRYSAESFCAVDQCSGCEFCDKASAPAARITPAMHHGW